MKEVWDKHKMIIIIGAVVAAALLVAVILVVTGVFDAEEEEEAAPVVTSAWPVAVKERVVPQPPEPVRWPLTGVEALSAEEVAGTRIVAVKIENSPAARPQTNLDQADIVYEALTEGGITRFNALFHSRTPDDIGPVRSARPSDIQLVPQYSALFANSGANTTVLRRLRSSGIENLDHGGTGAAYWRVRGRSAPHNLHVNITRIREAALARGYAATQTVDALVFSPSVDPAHGPSVTSGVTVPFSPQNRVDWSYVPDENVYLRENNGQPHVDRSGEQYRARNVVVMWAQTSATGPAGIGGRTLEISLVGSNRVSVFRDGVRIDGTWEASADKPPVFRDAEGRIVRLGPGVTWFQVVPTNVDIVVR